VVNTRTLILFVGVLSLLLGVWAVLSDTAAMGMAAGAVGFVAGLMALLPGESHDRGREPHEGQPQEAPVEPAGDSPTADHRPSEPAGAEGPIGDADSISSPSAAVDKGYLDSGTRRDATGADAALSDAPLMDPETELFSEGYLRVALESRLASARRHLRPVALALLEVAEGLPDQGGHNAMPTVVAEAVSRTLRDSDIACRMDDGTFAVILEDTPENGAVWTVERIRRNLVSTSGHHTLWAGVACYPAHAFDGPELLTAVSQALDAAKAWNQDRIEVAVAE
jgi:two-component system cell cycle response regulator